MKRFPTAITNIKRLSQSKLLSLSQNVITGLTSNAADFPGLPITVVTLTGYLSDYNDLLSLAKKGSKIDTNNKNAAKAKLVQALAADATYVNQVAKSRYYDGSMNFLTWQTAAQFIQESGYYVSKLVTRPNTLGNSRVAKTISNVAKNTGRTGANVNGQLKIRVIAAPKYGSQRVKTYWLEYQTGGTTPGPWLDHVSTSSRIVVDGLIAGLYNYRTAPIIGVFLGKDQLNFSPIQTAIVT